MGVFISHAHIDQGLAAGLKGLLDTITSRAVGVWYSSESRPESGMQMGDWRKQIWQRIEDAKTAVIIVTPQSNERPWLIFESGFAVGHKKNVVPVVYWMPPEKVHSVFKDHQAYVGDNPKGVSRLCAQIIQAESGEAPSKDQIEAWKPMVLKYLKTVERELQESEERNLFHDHFHNHETANRMKGNWVARWTGIDAEGEEEIFEDDTLRVWTDELRIRLVGDGAKGKPYPMEGVVSSIGQVALSYWSEGDTAICGTVLMKPPGSAIGSKLVGTWQGFTAPSLDEELTYFRGRVAMARIEAPSEEAQKDAAREWVDGVLAKPFKWMV